jgi:hypothetical protein
MPDRFQETDRGESEIMEIQMGPSHPASHGTVKFNLRLDGETIVDVDVEIGYLHRGFEKMCEQGTWNHCVPYADRLNYASPILNNVGFGLAVERLAGITAPERAQYIRVIGGEISRITDHLTCLGMAVQEAGAISAGFYMIEAREFLYDIVEALTGARLTVTFCRLGGVMNDLPLDIRERLARAFASLRGVLADCDKLLSRSRIFLDRTQGVGAIGSREAISWGITGPLLRATGVAYDVRKAEPYLVYDRFDFDVPTGTPRRQLRSLPGAPGGDRAEHAHHRAGPGADSRRPHHGRRAALRAAAQVGGLQLHRGPHEPLQGGDRGKQDSRGGGLHRHRGGQRRARLLPGERRQRSALPRARAAAVLLCHGSARRHAEGAHGGGHHHDVRADQHDRGRV